MDRIGKVHAALNQWYKPGRSEKEATSSRIHVSMPELEALLRTNNRDADGMPIPELGLRFDAWNGDLRDSASIMMTCGVFSAYVSNAVALNLPRTIIEERPELSEILLTILDDVWSPERTMLERLDGTVVENWKKVEKV
jgi:hypothetical protein